MRLQLQSIRRDGTGRVYVRWDDKTEVEYLSLEHLRDEVRETLTPHVLKALVLRARLAVDPALAQARPLAANRIDTNDLTGRVEVS